MKTNQISISIIDNLHIRAIIKELDTDNVISNIPSDLVIFSKKRHKTDLGKIRRRSERIQMKQIKNCPDIHGEEENSIKNEDPKSEIQEINSNQFEKNRGCNLHHDPSIECIQNDSIVAEKVSASLSKIPILLRKKIFSIIKNQAKSYIKELNKPESIKNEEVEELSENDCENNKEIKCFSKVRNIVPSFSLNIDALPKVENRPIISEPFSQLMRNIAGSSRNSSIRHNFEIRSPNTYIDLNFPSPLNYPYFQYSPFYTRINPYNFTPIYSSQNLGRFFSPFNQHFKF